MSAKATESLRGMDFAEYFWKDVADLPLCAIADQVPGLYLFGKDLEGRHVIGNKRTLERCGLDSINELLGRTDFEFYPEELCMQYAESDRKVTQTGTPILDLSELALNINGTVDWFITNKFPILNKKGTVVGMIGTTIEYEKSDTLYADYSRLSPAIQIIREHYMEEITLDQLANSVRLSPRQFQRQFKEKFHVSTREYIMRLRVHKACKLLRRTQLNMAEITQMVGFYDQSSFTRQFKKVIQTTPMLYRFKHKPSEKSH